MSDKKKKLVPFSIDEYPTIHIDNIEGGIMNKYGQQEAQKIIDSLGNKFIGKSKNTK